MVPDVAARRSGVQVHFNWQTEYVFKTTAELPKGTKIRATGGTTIPPA